jgi:cell division protein FtsI/penicillin-binding protein 2
MNKSHKLISEGSSWRALQAELKRSHKKARSKALIAKNIKFLGVFPIIVLAVYGIIAGFNYADSYFRENAPKAVAIVETEQQPKPSPSITKKDLQTILDGHQFLNLEQNNFNILHENRNLTIRTSIDMTLQHYLIKKLNRKHSRHIGIVALDPTDGRILAMAGFDKSDPSNNPCVDGSFPAASIFKIVTAAAAIEKCNLQPDSILQYNGRKHTLYKSQLKTKTTKYTNRISLKDSFAQSVNPIFGKLGANYLGKEALKSYAEAFGFNRKIDFELSMPVSHFEISDEPYQWAEIASGFNRQTRISPLHGALIVATILNRGKLIKPTIVDRITDENGRELYHRQPEAINQVITPKTSNAVYELMKATVKSGTAKREFRKHRRDKVLAKLEIGGKTGSINNQNNEARFDWFVGYAVDKETGSQIAVAVVVSHEKFIGTRASTYARLAIREYYKNYFANAQKPPSITSPAHARLSVKSNNSGF